MEEAKRISKLFNDLFDGHPWLDVNMMDNLRNITAEVAATKLAPQLNSIWEITNHLIQWRINVLQRLQGKILKTPDDNYFRAVSDTSDSAWTKTLESLEETRQQWTVWLTNFGEDEFEKTYSNSGFTYYELVHGILQHDAYHLGQIVMLSKAVSVL